MMKESTFGIIRLITITSIFLMMTSCGTADSNPESTYTLPNGNRVTYYTYQQLQQSPYKIYPGSINVSMHNNQPVVSSIPGRPMGGDVSVAKCRTWVETDSKGNIIRWQTQNHDCTPAY